MSHFYIQFSLEMNEIWRRDYYKWKYGDWEFLSFFLSPSFNFLSYFNCNLFVKSEWNLKIWLLKIKIRRMGISFLSLSLFFPSESAMQLECQSADCLTSLFFKQMLKILLQLSNWYFVYKISSLKGGKRERERERKLVIYIITYISGLM